MILAYPTIQVTFETVANTTGIDRGNPDYEDDYSQCEIMDLVKNEVEDDIRYIEYVCENCIIRIEIEQGIIVSSELELMKRYKELNWENIEVNSDVFLTNEEYSDLVGIE